MIILSLLANSVHSNTLSAFVGPESDGQVRTFGKQSPNCRLKLALLSQSAACLIYPKRGLTSQEHRHEEYFHNHCRGNHIVSEHG